MAWKPLLMHSQQDAVNDYCPMKKAVLLQIMLSIWAMSSASASSLT